MRTITACSIRVRGIVQGVGFRPFVYRLAKANALNGWVLNGEQGVEIHLEGTEEHLQDFLRDLKSNPPPAAIVSEVQVEQTEPQGLHEFAIHESACLDQPTVRISPDLPLCADCLRELFDPEDRRHLYPYINCTNCGPRYSVILRLPYDRPNTTMREWPLSENEYCGREYYDPMNRRFHAQPVACAACGPGFYLKTDGKEVARGHQAILHAVKLLNTGKIVAIKGLGGYHLACDALNTGAVTAMRQRKYRKEKPFAIMVRDPVCAASLVSLTADDQMLLRSLARPIVLAPAKVRIPGIAPDSSELGIILPYTPLQHLLFASGAPEAMVMTSANRSSEPIAYEDDDALERLSGIADAFLIGERPIARRVDDSVVRTGAFGPMILRRARGHAPGAVATLPTRRPILSVGADLKNTVTLVVDRQAFVSQHIGDLEHYQALNAFKEVIQDLVSMYDVSWNDLVVVHDLHPQYLSTAHALSLSASKQIGIQHHRAHIASVLAERGEWQRRVLGISFDGTGYGDDGTIWGGEIFVGSVEYGLARIAHLRQADLPGGDAAAQFPAQAAAGFLAQLSDVPDLLSPPFTFDKRYKDAQQLVRKQIRNFKTTSVGRLFDAAAALLGFTRNITYEGQAAIWVEQTARGGNTDDAYLFPFIEDELDFRPLLEAVICDRIKGRAIEDIARAFQRGVAKGLCTALIDLSHKLKVDTLVLSGGVFQNELLLEDVRSTLSDYPLTVWTNQAVPPNDGGISLGQAALAVFSLKERNGGLDA